MADCETGASCNILPVKVLQEICSHWQGLQEGKSHSEILDQTPPALLADLRAKSTGGMAFKF